MFVAASYASGVSEFYGLKELKVKESNRLTSMSNALSKNGVKLQLGNDSIKIYGQKKNFLQRFGVNLINEAGVYLEERAAFARFGL